MKKKVKKYAGGGLSGIADTANSLIGEVDGMANTIKYGSGGSGGSQKLGLLNMQPKSYDPTASFPGSLNRIPGGVATMDIMSPTSKGLSNAISEYAQQSFGNTLRGAQTFKKGGKVSSASKRADGIAIRGKTRA
jgi:hypothetical protein